MSVEEICSSFYGELKEMIGKIQANLTEAGDRVSRGRHSMGGM